MRATTFCKACGRVSKRRVGEVRPRRPLNWYPIGGGEPRVDKLVKSGADISVIKAEMQRCVALCQPCARKRAF